MRLPGHTAEKLVEIPVLVDIDRHTQKGEEHPENNRKGTDGKGLQSRSTCIKHQESIQAPCKVKYLYQQANQHCYRLCRGVSRHRLQWKNQHSKQEIAKRYEHQVRGKMLCVIETYFSKF